MKEARYFFDNGWVNIPYAPGVAPGKFDEIASLIRDGARMTVILDQRS